MLLPEPLARRFAAARAADAPEFEQVLIRLTIGLVIMTYLVVSFLWDGDLDVVERWLLVWVAIFLVVGVGLLGWCAVRPGVTLPRRWSAAILDVSTTSEILLLGDQVGTVLYGVYLWVVIGNGFRFGRRYMHVVQAGSVLAFAVVLLLSQYWRSNVTLGVGLLLTLIAVPAYVSKLLSRLEVAKAEAEAANVAKTRFLAAASHDLRQPVQALSMYASVLEGRTPDPDAQRVVHGVQLSVKTLERLFDSLLDISKIESGVVKPCLASFPLAPLLEQIAEEERPLAAQKGLELRAVRTSAWVESDPALLERMVKNLVTNAIRYTEHGRIVVGCRRAGERVRLEVLDTGIGIAAEEHGRIFDDYYQINGASGQGLGLGLPIVKSLGALLGHAVAVRSAPGRGSVFSIELPVTTGRDAPLPAPAAQAGPATGRVVLVDDDVEIRRSMHLLLQGWGYDLVSGSSVEDVEAELRARGFKPDALIVDYRLASDMTGAHVVERLRGAFGASLPALVITGNADVAAVRTHLPGLPIAVKPVPPGRLRAFLSQALTGA